MTRGCKSRAKQGQQPTETGMDSDVSLQNLADERAVSPVIGVILMVAITVILAAVIATFVLGIGGGQEQSPYAEFEFEKYNDYSAGSGPPDEFRVTHDGGDTIEPENLYITIEGAEVQKPGGSPPKGERLSWSDLGYSDDTVEVTDSVEFEPEDSNPDIGGQTVRIIWEKDGNSVVLATYEPED